MSRGPLKYLLQLVHILSSKKCPPLIDGRFITIGFSHYCEKSRWAISQSPMRVVEEMHCPAMHLSTTLVELRSIARFSPWKGRNSNSNSNDDNINNNNGSFSTAGTEKENESDAKLRKRKEITAVPKLVLSSGNPGGDNKPVDAGSVYYLDDGAAAAKSASPSPSPSFVVSDGSMGINKYLQHRYPVEMAHLYPAGPIGIEVERLEKYLDAELGPAVLNYVFGHLLLTDDEYVSADGIGNSDNSDNSGSNSSDNNNNHSNSNSNSNSGNTTTSRRSSSGLSYYSSRGLNQSTREYILNKITDSPVPPIERILFNLLGERYILPLMIEANGITAKRRDQSIVKIREIFSKIDNLLTQYESSDSHHMEGKPRYLFGSSRPSAADIALCSLCVPLLFPKQTSVNFGSIDEMLAAVKSHGRMQRDIYIGLGKDQKREEAVYSESFIGLAKLIETASDLRKTKTGKYIMNLFDTEHYNSTSKRLVGQELNYFKDKEGNKVTYSLSE